MAIIKCFVCNHFYDDVKYPACPHCAENAKPSFEPDFSGESKTMPMDGGYAPGFDEGDEAKTEAFYDDIEGENKTIGLFFQEEDYNPVTGWIVCVEGTVRGKSYEIHLNRNFIGRDKLMDITIPDDLQICRENHLSITYDLKSDRFFAKGEKGSLIINGKAVSGATEIFENDTLEFGQSKYVFIPYCSKERNWKTNEKD